MKVKMLVNKSQNWHPELSNLQFIANKINFNLKYYVMKNKNYGVDNSKHPLGCTVCVLLLFLWQVLASELPALTLKLSLFFLLPLLTGCWAP